METALLWIGAGLGIAYAAKRRRKKAKRPSGFPSNVRVLTSRATIDALEKWSADGKTSVMVMGDVAHYETASRLVREAATANPSLRFYLTSKATLNKYSVSAPSNVDEIVGGVGAVVRGESSYESHWKTGITEDAMRQSVGRAVYLARGAAIEGSTSEGASLFDFS